MHRRMPSPPTSPHRISRSSLRLRTVNAPPYTFPASCPPTRFIESGGVYKLVFGPKAFIVVSDPVVVRHILKVGPRNPTAS